MIFKPNRFTPTVFKHFCIVAILLVSAGSTIPAKAEAIVFPHENVSDLRGVLNVFHAFRKACLENPLEQDLPAKILPSGYKIVSSFAHLDWEPVANDTKLVLSKTGFEQGDWDGGHPFITMSMPSDKSPIGECSISWKRDWDYEEGQDRVAMGLAGVFDAQISYQIGAILRTRPDDAFNTDQPSYAGTSDWITFCWDRKPCAFRVIYNFTPNVGVDLSMSMKPIER